MRWYTPDENKVKKVLVVALIVLAASLYVSYLVIAFRIITREW